MPLKRSADEDISVEVAASKRLRPLRTDRVSRLSDELILRILSNLTLTELLICERLSHKYKHLARDGSLWKTLFYDHFVWPRAKRVPTIREGIAHGDTQFASKVTRWLDQEHLVKNGTNWKRQFRLRHNWSQGLCAVKEIPVAEEASVPPILVQMHKGVVYVADASDGLRAWSTKGMTNTAKISLRQQNASPPTSIAVNDAPDASSGAMIMIGFESGVFSIFHIDNEQTRFRCLYEHKYPSQGVLSAVAISWPHVVCLTATQLLTLYGFDGEAMSSDDGRCTPPQELHSLTSRTVWPPLSVSIRSVGSAVTISIAYALPTYLSGWTVGLQEVKVGNDGIHLESRTASAIEQHYRPLAFASRPMFPHLAPLRATTTNTSSTMELRHIHAKPNSLSYTHPYLLVSHPDNTLTLYLVTSNTETLSIGPGSRLWGHTSSVSGAHVGSKGKAVSVSRRGDELRVWELEGGFTSTVAKKRLADGAALSVRIKATHDDASTNSRRLDPASRLRDSNAVTGRTLSRASVEEPDLMLTRGWVGFDDENIVFLREESQGKQALMVYDFS